MYAEIIFPLPFRRSFTYIVPAELIHRAKYGVRAVVPFGKRTITGYIINVTDKVSFKNEIKFKEIEDILDNFPLFDKDLLKFYQWVADYYLCSLGEAVKLSIPYGNDIESKRKIVADKEYCGQILVSEKNKNSIRAKIIAYLCEKEVTTLAAMQKELKRKNIYSQIRKLQEEGVLTVLDEIVDPKVKTKIQNYVKLSKNIDYIHAALPELERRSPKQVLILVELLSSKSKEMRAAKLLERTGSSRAALNSLVKKKLVDVFDKVVERKYTEFYTEPLKLINLTDEQKVVIDTVNKDITNKNFNSYLLYGVTGSGKTQVYIELAKRVMAEGKNIVILVPEISLTPQITSRFTLNFPGQISVMHSKVSLGEKYDTWKNIAAGNARIVVGARSALFTPLKNIGLIIVDEEHDSSYKQYDSNPKYHGRDAALVLAKIMNCPIILGSATPSVESMFNAETGKYKLLSLTQRVDNASLPDIKLINVAFDEGKKRSDFIFSSPLLSKIEDRLKKKEGTIILQNRRGFSTQIFCNDCGEAIQCGNCSVPMVYHIINNTLTCHYCGEVKKVPDKCPKCNSVNLKYFGAGTEKVEDELGYYFPDAKIRRIDSDSITGKGSLSNILLTFSKGDIDILVGTQMVAKGLDFSRVSLVGVVSAETNLWLPDFRADERTFQLLTQVAGRAGRSTIKGEVLIQTLNPGHFVLKKVIAYDYDGFYKNEIELRRKFNFPPFTKLCLIEAKDENEEKAKAAIEDFYTLIKPYKKYIEINLPGPALISKIKGFYRFHILIKSNKLSDKNGAILRKAVYESYNKFLKDSKYKDVRITYDIDPQITF